MAEYKAPERDIKFALRNVLNVDQLAELDVFADATPDIIDGVIDEAAKFIVLIRRTNSSCIEEADELVAFLKGKR